MEVHSRPQDDWIMTRASHSRLFFAALLPLRISALFKRLLEWHYLRRYRQSKATMVADDAIPPARNRGQAPELGSRSPVSRPLSRSMYANHASLSPPSLAVREAVQHSLDGYATKGMAWYVEEVAIAVTVCAPDWPGLISATGSERSGAGRQHLGRGACRWPCACPGRRGDRVVVFDGEFPTNITPWQQAARPPWAGAGVAAG
jgi:hypothetical protein